MKIQIDSKVTEGIDSKVLEIGILLADLKPSTQIDIAMRIIKAVSNLTVPAESRKDFIQKIANTLISMDSKPANIPKRLICTVCSSPTLTPQDTKKDAVVICLECSTK